LRAATARSDFRGSTRPRWPAGDRACAPSSVAAARRRLLPPPSGAVGGAPTRGDQSHPPARAPCRLPCPPCAGALRGGVTAPSVGVARRRRAAAAAVETAAPLPRPTFCPPRQRGCTCPRMRSWLWSRPACPVSMRRRARHRPEGQSIARSAWNWILGSTSSKTLSTMYS